MSDSDKDSLSGLLSGFALGPAWAKANDPKKADPASRSFREPRGGGKRPPQRDDRRGDGRDRREQRDQRDPRGRRDDRGRDDRHREIVVPAPGVRVTLIPTVEAVQLIIKEVQQVARVYSLFDIAKTLLHERDRCTALFEVEAKSAPLFASRQSNALFLTKEEAVRHLWNQPDFRAEHLEEEVLEVEPPTGNFQSIARCGMSGELLGPPNFHDYQTNLRRLHRERFAHLPFEMLASRVKSERGEEAVNAWLETMKRQTRWRIKGDDDDAWITDRTEAERTVVSRCFDELFEETRRVEVSAAIPTAHLSPALLASLIQVGNHLKNHPAMLIPAACRAIEAQHQPVFKRQGKLFTGPARPQPLPKDAVLAQRPGEMVGWIRENPPAKLEGLWKAVLPEGSTAPSAEYAADLFWLLTQGHILLYTDDTLVVQEVREPSPPQEKAKKAKRKRKPKTATASAEPTELTEPTAAVDAAAASVAITSSADAESAESASNTDDVATAESVTPAPSMTTDSIAPSPSLEENDPETSEIVPSNESQDALPVTESPSEPRTAEPSVEMVPSAEPQPAEPSAIAEPSPDLGSFEPQAAEPETSKTDDSEPLDPSASVPPAAPNAVAALPSSADAEPQTEEQAPKPAEPKSDSVETVND